MRPIYRIYQVTTNSKIDQHTTNNSTTNGTTKIATVFSKFSTNPTTNIDNCTSNPNLRAPKSIHLLLITRTKYHKGCNALQYSRSPSQPPSPAYASNSLSLRQLSFYLSLLDGRILLSTCIGVPNFLIPLPFKQISLPPQTLDASFLQWALWSNEANMSS